MAGIIVELLISWLLLSFICKKHLSVLGFRPTKMRMTNLAVGLIIAASCCTLFHIMTTAFIKNSWMLNKQASRITILESSRWTLVSVLYEELIFRGALLYILIKKIGITRACILSAIGFGIYHWFTFNVLGNPLMMIVTFIMTAFVGLSWAFTFAKTGSLYLSIGLHMGWNWFCTVVFSNGNSGQAIFVRINDNQPSGLLSLSIFLFQVSALPMLTFWYLRRFSKNQASLVDEKEITTASILQ